MARQMTIAELDAIAEPVMIKNRQLLNIMMPGVSASQVARRFKAAQQARKTQPAETNGQKILRLFSER